MTPPQQFARLAIGQPGRGNLTASSPTDAESIPYDLWSFRAPTSESLQVSMTSPDLSLDTYLVVGRMQGGQFEELASNDDRGDGTLNSMVCFTPSERGDYVIRARSFWREQYGAYQLLVQPASSARAQAVARPLALGEELFGRLACDSALDADGGGYSYDLFSFQAEAGQMLQLSMDSGELDPFVVVGRMSGGAFEEIAGDDDGGEGLNSLLRFIPEESGEYVVRARTYAAEEYGNYRLLIQPISLVSSEQTELPQRAHAWAMPGEIAAAAEGDEAQSMARYMDFAIPARRGRSYIVRAVSTEFTPIVDVGLLQEDGRLSPVDFFSGTRASNVAEFSAQRGAYVVRVSSPSSASGRFDLIVSEAP